MDRPNKYVSNHLSNPAAGIDGIKKKQQQDKEDMKTQVLYYFRQYLASLQLDQTSLNPEPERLPQQLLEKCAALSVRPTAIKDLVDSMTGAYVTLFRCVFENGAGSKA